MLQDITTIIGRWCAVALTACLPLALQAHSFTQVGASDEVSALPVFAAQVQKVPSSGMQEVPCEQTDTVGPGGKAAVESELSDPEELQPAVQPADTARLHQVVDSIGRKVGRVKLQPKQFVPDPKRALWLSLVLPGAGQIYNRKYWKLPFIYGGFLGCAYALMWNQQMYRDYSQAYLDIMDDDPNTKSYLDMLPPRYDITGREDQFKQLFKRKKDYFRRYRDLSAFCFVGVYLLSVIDAYVDAQLSVFDISPDLSMSLEPAVIGSPHSLGTTQKSAYGVGCSFHF